MPSRQVKRLHVFRIWAALSFRLLAAESSCLTASTFASRNSFSDFASCSAVIMRSSADWSALFRSSSSSIGNGAEFVPQPVLRERNRRNGPGSSYSTRVPGSKMPISKPGLSAWVVALCAPSIEAFSLMPPASRSPTQRWLRRTVNDSLGLRGNSALNLHSAATLALSNKKVCAPGCTCASCSLDRDSIAKYSSNLNSATTLAPADKKVCAPGCTRPCCSL